MTNRFSFDKNPKPLPFKLSGDFLSDIRSQHHKIWQINSFLQEVVKLLTNKNKKGEAIVVYCY